MGFQKRIRSWRCTSESYSSTAGTVGRFRRLAAASYSASFLALDELRRRRIPFSHAQRISRPTQMINARHGVRMMNAYAEQVLRQPFIRTYRSQDQPSDDCVRSLRWYFSRLAVHFSPRATYRAHCDNSASKESVNAFPFVCKRPLTFNDHWNTTRKLYFECVCRSIGSHIEMEPPTVIGSDECELLHVVTSCHCGTSQVPQAVLETLQLGGLHRPTRWLQ